MSSERKEVCCPPPHFVVASAAAEHAARGRSAPARAASARSIRSTTRTRSSARSRARRSRPGPPSLWRYAPLLPVDAPAEQRLAPGLTPLVARAAPGRGARDRRALAQARHGQPDALVQGPRRRRRGREGAGARADDARLLLDREPRRRRRRARGRRGARRRGLLPGRPGAGEAALGRGLRADDLRRSRELRRLQPADGRALLRARLGLRERHPARLLRRGLEDARLRGRRAARLGAPGRRRRPDRLGRDVLQGRTRASTTCSRARARRRLAAAAATAARPRAARRSRRHSPTADA